MKIIDSINQLNSDEKKFILQLLSGKKRIETKKEAMDLLALADKVGKNNIALEIGDINTSFIKKFFSNNQNIEIIKGNDLEKILDVLALTYLKENKNDLTKKELFGVLEHIKLLEMENEEVNSLSFAILSELSKKSL